MSSMSSKSLLELSHLLVKHGINSVSHYLGNESLITRARNTIANAFLDSDCTHLLFIDVDLEFDPKDIVLMLSWSLKHNMELIGLPYAKKGINWAGVAEAVKAGVPVANLPKVAAYVAANFDLSNPEFDVNKPVEVHHVATGLMLIHKNVFLKMAQAYPERKYQLMADEIKQNSLRTTAYEFFRTMIDPQTGIYLSEDYAFCADWKELGGKAWLCPWAVTAHMGTYSYQCNISLTASYGLSLMKS